MDTNIITTSTLNSNSGALIRSQLNQPGLTVSNDFISLVPILNNKHLTTRQQHGQQLLSKLRINFQEERRIDELLERNEEEFKYFITDLMRIKYIEQVEKSLKFEPRNINFHNFKHQLYHLLYGDGTNTIKPSLMERATKRSMLAKGIVSLRT